MRPGGLGTSRMIDSDVTDLPQPDSPTMPSVSPGASEKLTPSTAANTLPPERNSVRRSLTSRRELIGQRGPPGQLERIMDARPEGPSLRSG